MNSPWTIFGGPINAVIQAAEQFGASRRDLLLAANIDESLLRQPEHRFPASLLFDIYRLADQATNNPDIGLTVGRISYLTGLNLHLYMATICHDVRDYLNLMPSLLKLKGDIGEMRTRKESQSIILEWVPLSADSAKQRYLSDEMLAAAALVFNSLCVFEIPVLEARFSYSRPADTSRLEEFFGSNLRFDQAVSGLHFDRKMLAYRLVEQSRDIDLNDSRSMAGLFDERDSHDAFISALRQSIAQNLPEGEVSLDTVAGDLNVSRRTLQRRLADRGTQFSQVLQELRMHLAVRYLSDKRLGMAEIAFLLGYGDQGSFSNAFKIWYGVSPREFRLQPKAN